MERALLIVSYGTAAAPARAEQTALEDRLAGAVPGCAVWRAVSSPAVRRMLAAQGLDTPSPAGAMERMLAEGVTDLALLPTHLVPGGDFAAVQSAAECRRGRFARLRVGEPLLADRDAAAQLARLAAGWRPARGALVLVGHGADGPAARCCYAALAKALPPGIFVGVLRGEPGFTAVLTALRAGRYRQVTLQPLLLTAGTHARRELAGPAPDSWVNRLRAAGFGTVCRMQGLAADTGVQQLYLHRLKQLLVP